MEVILKNPVSTNCPLQSLVRVFSISLLWLSSSISTHLGYTVLWGELEHLKIETRLINERFTSELGECVIRDVKGTTSIFKVIRSDTTLVFPMLDLSCDVEMFIWFNPNGWLD